MFPPQRLPGLSGFGIKGRWVDGVRGVGKGYRAQGSRKSFFVQSESCTEWNHITFRMKVMKAGDERAVATGILLIPLDAVDLDRADLKAIYVLNTTIAQGDVVVIRDSSNTPHLVRVS